jgi:uncharacterized protein (TIGR02246 family)
MNSVNIQDNLEEISAALVSKFDTAWNNRDPEALAAFFTEEADFQFYYGHLVRGRERIKKYFANKVFPYLPKGLRHITRSYKVRVLTDEVVIGDGRVDLVIVNEEGQEIRVQRRLKVTTVILKDDQGWRFSAVRMMVPVKD